MGHVFLRRLFGRLAGRAFFLGGEIRIEFFEDFLPGLLDVDVQILENASGDAVAFAEETQ